MGAELRGRIQASLNDRTGHNLNRCSLQGGFIGFVGITRFSGHCDLSTFGSPVIRAIEYLSRGDFVSELSVEIECLQVKEMIDQGEEFFLLDCRNPEEHARVHLEQAQLIPMQELPGRISELVPHKSSRIIVHCHLGGRSLQVTEWLRQQGFSKAQNMTGGIDTWAVVVDPRLPRY